MPAPAREPTRSRDFDAELILGPDATIGDKLRALRLSRKMTLAALSRASGLSDRAIRYIENGERQPGVDAVRKLSAALGVGTDFFMEEDLFRQEAQKEEVLQEARARFGSRGMAQARRIYEAAAGLYAGDSLKPEEREAFRDLMIELFFESGEKAAERVSEKRAADLGRK